MIPDYQSLMLPLLRLADDGQEHRIRDVIEPLANKLDLSQCDLVEMLPSGRQPIFNNRVHWAKTYLAQAKLLEITRRAHFRITQRGRDVLAKDPSKIDVKLLERFPEFNEFRQRARASQNGDLFPSSAETTSNHNEKPLEALATPDELLRTTIKNIEAALSSELLDRILSAPPAFFEELIVSLLLRMEYGGAREEAGRAIGKSGDGGIDGVIDQDPLGLDRFICRPSGTNWMRR
jgi:restriction system protein